jgi:nitrogen-specific signal transduction histidine kinase
MTPRNKIFDPFFTTKLSLGPGLSAVGIVRGHRGLLRLRSRPGKAALFELFFRLQARRRSRKSLLPRVEAKASGIVLIIDDETAVA